MKRSLFISPSSFFIAIAFILSTASASAGSGKHFLWRLKSPTNTIYFLGSIHAMQTDDYPLPSIIRQAFHKSSALVLELDLAKTNPADTRQIMLTKGLYANGRTLRDTLPPDLYQHAAKMAKQTGLDLNQYKTMKPWLASLVVLSTELQKAGFAAADGIDRHFTRLAIHAHKQVIGLETMMDQIGILAGLPRGMQQKLLLQSLQEANKIPTEMDGLVTAWKAGATKRLEAIMQKDFRGYPAVYRRLIVDRNRRWLPKLEKLIGRRRNYFVAVGSLHLIGKDGLIAHLRHDGYRVKQL